MLKYRNILEIEKIINNDQLNKFSMYFHKNLFDTGFLTGKQYLEKFSKNPIQLVPSTFFFFGIIHKSRVTMLYNNYCSFQENEAIVFET